MSPATQRPRRVRRWMDRLALYLPVLLMGALAALTYGLVRITPLPSATVEAPAPSQEPDYFFTDFSLRRYAPDGRLETELSGARAHHQPSGDSLEIAQPRLRHIDSQQRVTLAQARTAWTDSAGHQLRLQGDVQWQQAPQTDARGRAHLGWVLRGEALQADTQQRWVVSDRPVQVQRGADRFSAQRMRLDDARRTLDLTGAVRVWLVAPPAKKPA